MIRSNFKKFLGLIFALLIVAALVFAAVNVIDAYQLDEQERQSKLLTNTIKK